MIRNRTGSDVARRAEVNSVKAQERLHALRQLVAIPARMFSRGRRRQRYRNFIKISDWGSRRPGVLLIPRCSSAARRRVLSARNASVSWLRARPVRKQSFRCTSRLGIRSAARIHLRRSANAHVPSQPVAQQNRFRSGLEPIVSPVLDSWNVRGLGQPRICENFRQHPRSCCCLLPRARRAAPRVYVWSRTHQLG